MLINSINCRISSAKERKWSRGSYHLSKCWDERPWVQGSLCDSHSSWQRDGTWGNVVNSMFRFFFHGRVKKETRLNVSLLSVEAVAISDCIKSYFFQSPPHILGDSLLFYIRTNEL